MSDKFVMFTLPGNIVKRSLAINILLSSAVLIISDISTDEDPGLPSKAFQ